MALEEYEATDWQTANGLFMPIDPSLLNKIEARLVALTAAVNDVDGRIGALESDEGGD